MTSTSNIVQAEFFHLDRNLPFDLFMRQAHDRTKEGLSFKTTLRFEDTRGLVSQVVKRCHDTERRGNELLEMLKKKPKSRRLDAEITKTFSKLYALKRELQDMVKQELRYAYTQKHSIAVEGDARRFRMAEQNELHELVESAFSSKIVWVFLFPPNELLADDHKSSLHVM